MSKHYTREEVMALMAKFQATTTDYLIYTCFKIHNLTQGPLYQRYQRRLSNITLNNLSVITRQLTLTAFTAKTYEILRRELQSVKYLSCIYPIKTQTKAPCPIFVQFFDKSRGLEFRLLEFCSSPSALGTILTQHNIFEKVVGYCGDYCYHDANATSDHFTTLRLLSGNDVKNLPYCDGFINTLFDILVDYLGEDVTVALDKIGRSVKHLGGNNSQFAKEFLKTYTEWSESDQHILLSSYAKFVCDNFTAVNEYLLPYRRIFKSVVDFLGSVRHRFYLIFAYEIYNEINKIKLSDNNAIVYYFYLKKLRDVFKTHADNHFIPTKAWNYINNEIDYLIANKQLDPQKDAVDIDTLFSSMTLQIDKFYVRAIKYIEPLLTRFNNFDTFSWILLNDAKITPDRVHETYHTIYTNTSCERCESLVQNVISVNSVMSQVPLLDINSVVTKWVVVLSKSGEVPMLLDLLQYLLCLPASCKIEGIENGDEYVRAKSMIRMNLKNVSPEMVVTDVEGFFGEHLEEASDVIKRHKIPLLLD